MLIASQVCAGEENALKIRVYGDKGGLEWRQMEPNSVIYRPVDAPYQVYRAGQGQVGLCDAASARCRVPAGHPEGYLEAMANLYTDFAKAVRANQKGKADIMKTIILTTISNAIIAMFGFEVLKTMNSFFIFFAKE